jgi:hypothetical protein
MGLPKTDRMGDVVDVCWQARRIQLGSAVGPDIAKIGLWCDPSQGVNRLPMRLHPPTLCQGTLPYSYEYDCVLSGQDALALQGFPDPFSCAPPHEFVDQEVRSLAGEAFFLPSCMSVVYAYYLNPSAPWWRAATEEC